MGFIFSLIVSLISFSIALVPGKVAGEKQKRQVWAIAMLIGSLMALLSIVQLVSRFLIIMPAGSVGVVEELGEVKSETLKPGVHFINPFANVVEFTTRLKDIKETVTATSSEGLNLNIDVSLQYKIEPNKAGEVYENIGTDETEIITSRFRSIIRQITASYEARAIYGEKRQEVTQSLHEQLSQQLTPLGFVVEETLLRNVVLPKNIQEAIQAKLEAEQENERQQFVTEKQRQELEFELEKARKEAERQKIEAQGIADAQRLLSQSLTDKILQMKAIEATQDLAKSPNAKVIIIGGGKDKLPLILQQGE